MAFDIACCEFRGLLWKRPRGYGCAGAVKITALLTFSCC
jgi:hypothetical protein